MIWPSHTMKPLGAFVDHLGQQLGTVGSSWELYFIDVKVYLFQVYFMMETHFVTFVCTPR